MADLDGMRVSIRKCFILSRLGEFDQVESSKRTTYSPNALRQHPGSVELRFGSKLNSSLETPRMPNRSHAPTPVRKLCLLAALLLVVGLDMPAAAAEPAKPSPQNIAFFENKVRPVLS